MIAALMTLALGLSFAVPVDPYLDESLQRDVIGWHLSQGATPETACAAVTRYTGRDCAGSGGEFIISRGHGLNITYLVTLTFFEKEQ